MRQDNLLLPQIILIHGMWSQAWVWRAWQTKFEEAGYRCTAVTLPGHAEGQPDEALKRLGLADYVKAVSGVAKRFDRPVLIGHSLGGLVAQQVAAHTAVRGLVLVCSAAPGEIFPLRPKMLPGLARHFLRWDLWRQSFRLSRWEAQYLLFNNIPKHRQDSFYRRLTAESGRLVFQLGFGRLNLAGSNRVAPSNVKCPILALAGVQDRIIPISVSRRLAAYYGEHMQYREFPQHAHWMLDEPDSANRVAEIIVWLGQTSAV